MQAHIYPELQPLLALLGCGWSGAEGMNGVAEYSAWLRAQADKVPATHNAYAYSLAVAGICRR